MTTLVFDTETSGFFDPKLALDDPQQGRVIQLAAVLFSEQFEVINSFYSLIKPDGWSSINPRAEAAHGISFEMCEQYGIPIKSALEIFAQFYINADCRVAHNIKFDSVMVDNEQLLIGMPVYEWKSDNHYCTMQEMTPICQLPSNGKFGAKFKWPKLQEAHYHCFSKNFDDAHDSLADVMATSRIFKWLLDNGHVVIPKAMSV